MSAPGLLRTTRETEKGINIYLLAFDVSRGGLDSNQTARASNIWADHVAAMHVGIVLRGSDCNRLV